MLAREFIHIHIPRTGGQKIRSTLSRCQRFVIWDWPMSHRTLKDSRERLAGYIGAEAAAASKSFCFVRNPWDWYVSRYFFRSQRKMREGVEVVTADHCGDGPEGFRKHMDILKHAIDTGTHIMTDKGVPACTRTYIPKTLSEWHYKLVGDGTDMVGRFEDFSNEFARILSSCQSRLDADQLLFMAEEEKINASRHDDYHTYYDDETRAWVAEWDLRYIEEFGYEF